MPTRSRIHRPIVLVPFPTLLPNRSGVMPGNSGPFFGKECRLEVENPDHHLKNVAVFLGYVIMRETDSNPRSPHVSVRPRTLNSRTLRRERCLLHLARMALAGDPRFVAGPEKPKVHDNNHNI